MQATSGQTAFPQQHKSANILATNDSDNRAQTNFNCHTYDHFPPQKVPGGQTAQSTQIYTSAQLSTS